MLEKIFFATCEAFPELSSNDRLAATELAKVSYAVEPAVWTRPRDWRAARAVVIRATWDYWLRYPQFLAWFDELEAGGMLVCNPLAILRENTRKTYLRRLQARGVPIVPTEWIEPGDFAKVASLAEKLGEAEVVLKPVVSGGAHQTFRLRGADLAAAIREPGSEIALRLQTAWAVGPAILQPFQPAILSEGEYSFLFFGGEFSHCVLKRGAPGDFRVQRAYGGTSRAVAADPHDVAFARGILDHLPEIPLYARVDLLRVGGRLHLMEIELTEPDLFFADHPGSAVHFARKLHERLRRTS